MFHMTFPYGEACDSEQYSISKFTSTAISLTLNPRNAIKRVVVFAQNVR